MTGTTESESRPEMAPDSATRAPATPAPSAHADERHAMPLASADLDAYAALHDGAVWFAGAEHWSSVRGPKAGDALNGLVTNEVAALAVGDGVHAAALTPKGKVIADLMMFRTDDETFLVSTPIAAADGWMTLVRKYVNPRLAKLSDESDRVATWVVCGKEAPRLLANLLALDDIATTIDDPAFSDWPVGRHVALRWDSVDVRVLRIPMLGETPSFVLLADIAAAAVLQARIVASPIVAGSAAVRNVARVESGQPLWGIDMDEQTIPQEANLQDLNAISFSKGCYIGQETVARIHFRGHVNRNLRGLTSASALSVGASLTDESGKVVGDVRSVATSPAFGQIAMAMVRREVAAGARVVVTSGEEVSEAQVSPLPFRPPT